MHSLHPVIDKMVKVVGWYDNEIGYSSIIDHTTDCKIKIA
jgi:glyceraldehyde-3-phosphate dehydrogenase/erythrose-4-phosphate dehydrogenase